MKRSVFGLFCLVVFVSSQSVYSIDWKKKLKDGVKKTTKTSTSKSSSNKKGSAKVSKSTNEMGDFSFSGEKKLTVNNKFPEAIKVDFDKDGDFDLITYSGSNDPLILINNGKGNFTNKTIKKGARTNHIAVGDLNGDKQPDFVMTNRTDGIHWFENLGGGKAFEMHSIVDSNTMIGGSVVGIGDVDKDGKNDVIYGSKGIFWVKNENGKGSAWSSPEKLYDTGLKITFFNVGDYDKDGDADCIFAQSKNKVVYFKNNKGKFKADIIYETSEVRVVNVVDVNKDGYLDVLASNGGGLSFLENVKGKTFSENIVVPKSNHINITNADAADFDGDGDNDILVSRKGKTGVVVNSGKESWGKEKNVFTDSSAVMDEYRGHAIDLNKDKKPDVAFLSYRGDKSTSVWIKNTK